MAEEKFKTRQEAQAKLVTALQENGRKLRQAYTDNDQAAIDKYSKNYDRLTAQLRASTGIGNIGAGIASTAVGMLTGLPDIGISAYNYLAEPKTPISTLRERLLSFAQIPSQAVSEEDQLAYSAPDIASGVVGLTQLAQLGYKGVKGWLQGRQTKELLSKLSPEEQNFFKDLMVKGQGSPNTEVAATIARLERDPKYSEIFNALKREASTRATSGVAPAVSRISEEQAGTGAALGVKNKIDGLAEARKVAGDSAFTQAFGYAEGKQLVDPKKTLENIDGLIARYSKQTTPNAERAVEVLTAIREKFQPTITTKGSEATQYTVRQGIPALRTSPTSYVVREATPDINIQGAAARTTTRNRTVVEYDSLGLPRTRVISEEIPVSSIPSTTIKGTPEVRGVIPGINRAEQPAVMGTIPGAQPFTTQGGIKQLTAEEVQGILSEFGKKASQGDSLIKDLSLSDEKIISSAIFGGMKDDLVSAAKSATGNDKVALNFLIKARADVANASTKYNDAIAQGLPAFLKDKPLNSISFEDLYSQYKGATPAQRATFRSYIQNTDPESLKNFDSRVWQDFSGKYATILDDGMPGIDLAKMAKDWTTISPQDKDAIATALGQNLSEFDKRMKDALVFTRRVSTGQPQGDGAGLAQVTREASAVVGASPAGYQGAKLTQLAGDVLGIFRKGGISNELAMKTLLTPEGASFLKTAKLSPGSQQTLQSLMEVANAPLAAPSWMSLGTAVSPKTQAEETSATTMTAPSVDGWIDPDEMQPTMKKPSSADSWIDPDAATASPAAPMGREDMRRQILQSEMSKALEAFSSSQDPAQKIRLQNDINALNNELSRLK